MWNICTYNLLPRSIPVRLVPGFIAVSHKIRIRLILIPGRSFNFLFHFTVLVYVLTETHIDNYLFHSATFVPMNPLQGYLVEQHASMSACRWSQVKCLCCLFNLIFFFTFIFRDTNYLDISLHVIHQTLYM